MVEPEGPALFAELEASALVEPEVPALLFPAEATISASLNVIEVGGRNIREGEESGEVGTLGRRRGMLIDLLKKGGCYRQRSPYIRRYRLMGWDDNGRSYDLGR